MNAAENSAPLESSPVVAMERQIQRAQWRLNLQRFLEHLIWCAGGGLIVAAALILWDKWRPLGLEPAAWIGVGLVGGLLVALGMSWYRRLGKLEAAIELDRRFGLRERVSSSLALSEADRGTAIGQALLADAARRVQRVHVAEKFAPRLRGKSLAPLGAAALVLAIAWFVDPFDPAGGQATASPETPAVQEQIRKQSELLKKKIAEQQQLAEEKGLQEAQELMARLEQETERVQLAESEDRKEALVKLNDLAKEVQQRRQQLGDSEALKKQLEQMKNLAQGPADKMAEALRNGDFEQALNELEKLKQQLAEGSLPAEEQQKLAEQLDQMAEKLREMATAQQEQQQRLQEEIKRQREAGNSQMADQLEQQLEQLRQQGAQQQQQLQDLASQLGQCAECMKKGDAAGAEAQLSELAGKLGDIQQQMSESQMMEQLLDEISQCKDGMCQGNGNGQSSKEGEGGGGLKAGRGRGPGLSPDEQPGVDGGFYDSQVRQQIGRGSMMVRDMVDGPNAQGQIREEIQSQYESGASQESDPVATQQLPRDQRDHARQYFDALRQGR